MVLELIFNSESLFNLADLTLEFGSNCICSSGSSNVTTSGIGLGGTGTSTMSSLTSASVNSEASGISFLIKSSICVNNSWGKSERSMTSILTSSFITAFSDQVSLITKFGRSGTGLGVVLFIIIDLLNLILSNSL